MLSRILAAAALVTALATTAFAADSSSRSSANTSALNSATNANGANATSNAQQTAQNLPQEIRAKLKDDGFTDVKVVPGSFIVSAKDKKGEPVTMVIGPDSMMMVTQVTNGRASSTNGQK
jgi:opacity protein-like surface antigen